MAALQHCADRRVGKNIRVLPQNSIGVYVYACVDGWRRKRAKRDFCSPQPMVLPHSTGIVSIVALI